MNQLLIRDLINASLVHTATPAPLTSAELVWTLDVVESQVREYGMWDAFEIATVLSDMREDRAGE